MKNPRIGIKGRMGSLILIAFVLVIIGIFLTISVNRDSSYTNTEYKYSLSYPQEAEITFISSMNGSTSIATADTVGIMIPNVPIRIQASNSFANPTDGDLIEIGTNDFRYHGVKERCSYSIFGPSSTLCISLDQAPDELMKNTKLFSIFKSIRLY